MQLTPEVVAMYKDFLVNPAKHKLDYKPISECFEKSETVTAKHILWHEYIAYLQRPLHKVIGYIIMDEVFGQCDGKDEKGSLGYHLKFVANDNSNISKMAQLKKVAVLSFNHDYGNWWIIDHKQPSEEYIIITSAKQISSLSVDDFVITQRFGENPEHNEIVRFAEHQKAQAVQRKINASSGKTDTSEPATTAP